MGLASSSRYNSAATNAAYALVPAVHVRLLDVEAEQTARLDAAYGETIARVRENRPTPTPKPRPTPRADLLAMLEAAKPYIAHAAEGGADKDAVALLEKMRGLVR